MHNNSTRISANEINRYVYCNYQWYYRRVYGDAKLTKFKKEHNKALGIKRDARTHAFIKGNRFHKRYHRWYKIKKLIYLLAFLSIIAIVLYYAGPKVLKEFF
ncbi:MAG: PD-(D/E)XK nuclease family protein [Epulopiscium sp.]|nr:PD-(D/E)XK nuclease family protein [Candidatus Epulonipiscium sp.]